jgi:hypothetical protein
MPIDPKETITPYMYNRAMTHRLLLGIVCGFLFILCVIIFFTPSRPKVITKEVEKVVEKEVVKEVVKEVINEVPAKISDEIKFKIDFYDRFWDAKTLESQEMAFHGIQDFAVSVFLNKNTIETVDKDLIQNKFELTLQKNGVKINAKSTKSIDLIIEGLWDKDKVTCTYTQHVTLSERAWIIREKGAFHFALVDSWRAGVYGYAGKNRLQESLIETAEKQAEAIANIYLKNR